jgi:L-seryl-tRNA(Ser) seleniumtransferase
MASSGTRMVEVGTTNRTHLEDYRRAISEDTRLIMRVHPSNYRIVGFVSVPDRAELAALSHKAGLPLYEDAGSGQLADLRKYGVVDEPVVRDIIESGVDVVSFSGDKLLGSAQAGLIVGTRSIVSQLRKHPLYRALRSDKLRLAALEATLISHQRDVAELDVPVIKMLSATPEELRQRAQSLAEGLDAELLPSESALGGGAGPTSILPTTLLAITHPKKSAHQIEHELRHYSPPIIATVADEKVLLDLRTVFEDQLPTIRAALATICK